MKLTETELRVLARIVKADAAMCELTSDLGMSKATIRVHISRIRDKAEEMTSLAEAREVIFQEGKRYTLHPEIAAALRC